MVEAAIHLFATQGLVETTTRQISELAGVNEVTLFRQFESKYGLLLSLLQDEQRLQQWLDLVPLPVGTGDAVTSLQACARDRLLLLAQYPELTRSLVGEAEHFSPDTRRALGQWLQALNRRTSDAITAAISNTPSALPPDRMAELLNALAIGAAVTEMMNVEGADEAEFDVLADAIATVFFPPEPSAGRVRQVVEPMAVTPAPAVVKDLPTHQVRAILLQAKKLSIQDYAIAYVAFGAGASAAELASLKRTHHLSDARQHLLLVPTTPPRQVPINRWIMEHRYGTYVRNPLTQWLKSRKDEQPSLFLDEAGEPASEQDLQARWQGATAELEAVTGEAIGFEQAQDTWRVEMLMKGMSLENLSILSGCSAEELEPYARRAKEKIALARALEIDQKRSGSSS